MICHSLRQVRAVFNSCMRLPKIGKKLRDGTANFWTDPLLQIHSPGKRQIDGEVDRRQVVEEVVDAPGPTAELTLDLFVSHFRKEFG